MNTLLKVLALPLMAIPLAAASCAGGGAGQATVAIHYSHFEPEMVIARAGVPITITLRNDDPIEHEWIVGTDDVHERHRIGTEPSHNGTPAEVTIPPLSTRVTTVVFARPGDYKYVCHLPGHEQYGMVGTLHVGPA